MIEAYEGLISGAFVVVVFLTADCVVNIAVVAGGIAVVKTPAVSLNAS